MCHESWRPAGREAAVPEEVAFTVSDGTRMPGWRYGGGGTRGSCLVLPDVYGPSPFYHRVTELLAVAGHEAVLFDYFFRQGAIAAITREAAFARRARMDENLCLRDVSDVLDALRDRGAGARVGVLGFCLSGTFALDLATMRDDLATVCYYAFPEGPGGPVAAEAPKPIDVAGSLNGPITAFWGDQDHIPLELIERFGARVARRDVDYTQRVYPGAGHGFLQGLVEEREDSTSARDAWRRTIEFFELHVAGAAR